MRTGGFSRPRLWKWWTVLWTTHRMRRRFEDFYATRHVSPLNRRLCVPKILRMTPAMILPIGDAARRLGLSVDTLRRMDKDGRLPALRIGGRRCYEVERINEFIRRHQPAEPAA